MLGFLGSLLLFINTAFWCFLIYPLVLFKMFGFSKVKIKATQWMIKFGEAWIFFNGIGIGILYDVEWDVQGLENLSLEKSYLVCSNHQSWVDIVVLQYLFNRRIPFLRFFIKKELIYTPLLGVAWWALDFPIMRRYSKEYLEKHPEKRGDDLKETRKACEKFRGSHISILNFLEGTRLTKEKHQKTGSGYTHLLAPKTGGMTFVLQSMGEQFDSVLDVTIVYPLGVPTLWDLLNGKLKKVVVRVNRLEVPNWEGPTGRAQIKTWIQSLWQKKDQQIKDILNA